MSGVSQKFWVIIPAAGSSRRMAGEMPKQYLPLAKRTVIEWALAPFLECKEITGILVALAKADAHWPALAISRDPRIHTAIGGDERVHSVALAMQALAARAQPNDWVLVHDAARPCLSVDDLQKLKREVAAHPVGGLLASPVADTLKRASIEGDIDATIPRENLWRALTPQMFRFKLLNDALQTALAKKTTVTDEASAVEALGHRPRLIAGRADNIKITLPEDLQLAEQVLRNRSSGN